VKVKKGESPIKGGGKLLVIDGGFCKAYQSTSGIAADNRGQLSHLPAPDHPAHNLLVNGNTCLPASSHPWSNQCI
ncbi:MAG: fructose-bisphosphatase class III, partial [Erysipelotrichaceae bacterium]|nr:fructose-bisphosphatase class III [Erysipelotrichaceae bacterium]